MDGFSHIRIYLARHFSAERSSVLGADIDAAYDEVTRLHSGGMAAETLFLDLLQPAARHLGEVWHRDECDFVDVTVGVARLQGLLAFRQ